MKKIFEYVLLTLAILSILVIIIKREGFSNLSSFPSAYKELLLDSFKRTDDTSYKSMKYSEQAKNVPKSEMSSYSQVTKNISPNLISTPCDGNEPFPGMCSTLYATY